MRVLSIDPCWIKNEMGNPCARGLPNGLTSSGTGLHCSGGGA
jgi:hypothetical protein